MGFFHFASYAFLGFFALAAASIVASLAALDAWGLVAALLLAPVSALCAVVAFAHEGLAQNVADAADLNESYAERSAQLAEQLRHLGVAEQRLASLAPRRDGGLRELRETLEALRCLAGVTQLSAMLQAAEHISDALEEKSAEEGLGSGTASRATPEIEALFRGGAALLREAAPEFHLGALYAEAAELGGLDRAAARLLVSAAACGAADEAPGRGAAQLSLLRFSLDPDGAFEECHGALSRALGRRITAAQIRAMLEGKVGRHITAEGRVPCKELLDISERIMMVEMSSG